MRARGGRRRDPPVLPARLRGAPPFHGAGDPAHVPGQRDPADGIAGPGAGRGLPLRGPARAAGGARRREPAGRDRRPGPGRPLRQGTGQGRAPGIRAAERGGHRGPPGVAPQRRALPPGHGIRAGRAPSRICPARAPPHPHRPGPGAPADRPAPGQDAAGGGRERVRLGGARHRRCPVHPGRARAPRRAPGGGRRRPRAPGGPPFGFRDLREPVALPQRAGAGPVGVGVPAPVPRRVPPLPAFPRMARRGEPVAPDGPPPGHRRGPRGGAPAPRRRRGDRLGGSGRCGGARGRGLHPGHGDGGRGPDPPFAAGGPAVQPGQLGRVETRLRGRAGHPFHDLAGFGRGGAPGMGDGRGAGGDLAPLRPHGGAHPPRVGRARRGRPGQTRPLRALLVLVEGRGDGQGEGPALRPHPVGGPPGAAGRAWRHGDRRGGGVLVGAAGRGAGGGGAGRGPPDGEGFGAGDVPPPRAGGGRVARAPHLPARQRGARGAGQGGGASQPHPRAGGRRGGALRLLRRLGPRGRRVGRTLQPLVEGGAPLAPGPAHLPARPAAAARGGRGGRLPRPLGGRGRAPARVLRVLARVPAGRCERARSGRGPGPRERRGRGLAGAGDGGGADHGDDPRPPQGEAAPAGARSRNRRPHRATVGGQSIGCVPGPRPGRPHPRRRPRGPRFPVRRDGPPGPVGGVDGRGARRPPPLRGRGERPGRGPRRPLPGTRHRGSR